MQFETRPVGDGVYEIRDVETGEQFLMNVNTMATSIELDPLIRDNLMLALEEFGIVQQINGTYQATERGSQSGTPERVERPLLSGKDAWNANFKKSGPPDWVTSVGGSWGSSPSGWNSGGWDPTGGDPFGWGKLDLRGNPMTNAAWSLEQSRGGRSDNSDRGGNVLNNVGQQINEVAELINSAPPPRPPANQPAGSPSPYRYGL